MSEDSTDCLQCRLTSGCGLAAAGVYVVYQSKKLKPFSRHVVASIGYGFCLLGFLRVFNLPPFGNKSKAVQKTTIESKEENEYIIGKFSKFNQ